MGMVYSAVAVDSATAERVTSGMDPDELWDLFDQGLDLGCHSVGPSKSGNGNQPAMDWLPHHVSSPARS